MNPIKRGIFDTFSTIKKNKLLFFGLMIIQLLFLISISYVAVNYQIEIYSNLNEILDPLKNANFNATSLESGQPFLPDMSTNLAAMTKGYNQMIKGIFEALFLIFGCYILFNGFLWSIANYLVKSKRKNSSFHILKKIGNYWKKFTLLSLFFLIPTIVLGYYLLINLVFDSQLLKDAIQWVEIFLLVVFYFLIIGFCHLDSKIKNIFIQFFRTGIFQAHWVLISLFINLVLIFLSLLLIYYSTDSLFFMTLGIFLTIFF